MKSFLSRLGRFSALFVATIAAGCGDGASSLAERQACYPNGTCNPGLTCVTNSKVCVDLGGTGGTGGTGGRGGGGGAQAGSSEASRAAAVLAGAAAAGRAAQWHRRRQRRHGWHDGHRRRQRRHGWHDRNGRRQCGHGWRDRYRRRRRGHGWRRRGSRRRRRRHGRQRWRQRRNDWNGGHRRQRRNGGHRRQRRNGGHRRQRRNGGHRRLFRERGHRRHLALPRPGELRDRRPCHDSGRSHAVDGHQVAPSSRGRHARRPAAPRPLLQLRRVQARRREDWNVHARRRRAQQPVVRSLRLDRRGCIRQHGARDLHGDGRERHPHLRGGEAAPAS